MELLRIEFECIDNYWNWAYLPLIVFIFLGCITRVTHVVHAVELIKKKHVCPSLWNLKRSCLRVHESGCNNDEGQQKSALLQQWRWVCILITSHSRYIIWQQGQKAVKFIAMRYHGKIRGKPGLLSCSTITRTSHWNATLLPVTLSLSLGCLLGTYRIHADLK